MEFTFEESAWELEIGAAAPGKALSASRLMALLEGEDEDAAAEAFNLLEAKRIPLNIDDLPEYTAAGETAVRLRREAELVKKGTLERDLEENDPLRLYLEELGTLSVPADREALAARSLKGDESAMRALSEALLPQVIRLAQELTGKGVLLLDLIQEGSLGLWQGILQYTGGDITQHCLWFVRQAMAKAVFLQARAGGVGQKLRRDMERFAAADGRLLTELGRNPTLAEIADKMGIPMEEADRLQEMLAAARLAQKVKQAMAPKEETPDDEQAVENTAYYQSRQRIAELLSNLPEEDARLISLRFGLDGQPPLSPEEAGKQLRMTPEEVIAREAQALGILREK